MSGLKIDTYLINIMIAHEINACKHVIVDARFSLFFSGSSFFYRSTGRIFISLGFEILRRLQMTEEKILGNHTFVILALSRLFVACFCISFLHICRAMHANSVCCV